MSRLHRLARAGRGDDAANARLDDLLNAAAAADEPTPDDGPEPWVGRAVIQTAVASVVVSMGFLVANLVPPVALIIACCASAVAIRRAIGQTGEPYRARTHDVVRRPDPPRSPGGGWPYGGDGMREAVRRWDRRLEWGATEPGRFRVSVSGRLAAVAEERLRQRHGFTPAQNPQRARTLLGEAAWEMLYGQGRINPTTRELAAVLERLESL